MAKIGVEWINDFPPPCDQNELSYCDETSVGFLNGMVSRGHTETFNWGNGNAFERDFRDPAFGGEQSAGERGLAGARRRRQDQHDATALDGRRMHGVTRCSEFAHASARSTP